MDNVMADESKEIGQRVKELRKRKGLNQKDLADLLGKSLRTVQKYESGEIEISIAMMNEIARHLDTTSTYLMGYKASEIRFTCMADVMDYLFKLSMVKHLDFSIDVKRPPNFDGWECSLTFNGKEKGAEFNADLCLFLEQWNEYREDFRKYMIDKESYEDWQDKTLAYYASTALETEKLEDVDFETRIKRRDAIINEELSGKP